MAITKNMIPHVNIFLTSNTRMVKSDAEGDQSYAGLRKERIRPEL